VQIADKGSADTPANVHYTIVNAGDLPAKILEFQGFAYIQHTTFGFTPKFDAAFKKRPENLVLVSGASVEVQNNCVSVESEYDEFKFNGAKLFVVGKVTYRALEDSSPVQTTGFCRRYNVKAGAWHTVDGSEYEYSY
jgi:hypothetical protein